jgi:glycosyltransferase involved in cell wall biosynthesis
VATLHTWEGILKRPIVFDVDDAIFAGPRGNSANKIAQRAEIIICGNSYLANHFERLGKVEILPTAVDSERYKPKYVAGCDEIVIGWSGTSGGFEYLYDIEESLSQVLKARPKAVLKIVSDRRPNFKLIPEEQFRYEAWTATSEVQALQRFSIGIMPLADDPWSRGKCSFKMLTYMAVGIPVVVSPVGMNIEILNKGTCGLAASSLNEWVETLINLIDDEGNRRRMGSIGRDILEKYYSRKVIGPRLAEIISSVAR